MKEERKKVEKNLVGSITPKKREEPIESIVKEIPTESKTSVKSKTEPKQEPETPKTVLKFVKVCDGSKQEERKEIGDKVMRGELKWHYYAIDGDKGCHYYLILKN